MKKTIFTILFCLICVPAWAGMTCTEIATSIAPGKWRLDVLMEFDTTPGTATCTLSGEVMDKINELGLYIYENSGLNVSGETNATATSDLAISDSVGKVILSATGNGANFLNNSGKPFYGDNAGGGNHYSVGLGRDWTLTVTENVVSNSTALYEMIGVE